MAEADAAHDTLVRQRVDEVDVQGAPVPRVEYGEPVGTLPLIHVRQLVRVEVGEGVADVVVLLVCQSQRSLLLARRRGWSCNMWGAGVRRRGVLLWRCRSRRPSATRSTGAVLATARRRRWLGGLDSVSC